MATKAPRLSKAHRRAHRYLANNGYGADAVAELDKLIARDVLEWDALSRVADLIPEDAQWEVCD